MFFFKKLVSFFLFPLSLVLELSVIGLCLLWLTKQQRLAKVVLSSGIGMLVLLSLGIVADLLLAPLERKYVPFDPGRSIAASGATISEVGYVVVLGGGHVSDPTLQVTSQIGDVSMVRLVEGMRIHRQIPGSKLVVSGGAVSDPVPNARIMARVAEQLGALRGDIVIDDQARDTRQEALRIESIVGTMPFVLVTSASHMPRSMALFRAVGTNPIPAPVGHLVKRRGGIGLGLLLPRVGHLEKSTTAFYEYMGLVWAKLRGFA